MPGGGGFGHIADMIARIKANETLKHEILQRRFKYVYFKTSGTFNLKSRETTEAELQAIRQKMREESRHERIRSLWALLITLVFLIGLYFGLQYLFYKIF
jgi:hypothetical protein